MKQHMNTLTEFTPPVDYNTNKSSPLKWILSHVLRYRVFFIPILLIQILASFSQALVPIFIGQVGGALLEQKLSKSGLLQDCLFIGLAGVGAGFFNLIRAWLTEILANRLERDGRDELYANLIGKSLTFHDSQSIGDVMARASTDVRQLNLMLNPGFLLVFAAASGIVVPYAFMGMIHFQLLLVPVLFLIAYLVVLKIYNHNLGIVSFRQRVINGAINSKLNQVISGIYLVRGMNQEQRECIAFERDTKDFRRCVVEQGKIQARYYPILLLGVATALALFHGLWLVHNGEINYQELIAYIGLMQLLRFPTFINIFAMILLTMGIASARRILQLINAKTEIDSNPTGYAETIQGHIKFENVTFGYTPGKPVLKNISFEVQPGQTVALVGMTGSGKTTITKLLTRLYDPQEGHVMIDGVDVRDWSIQSLRGQMALVEQDVFLFSKSIKDNIKFGAQEATDEEVYAAARLAQAHKFIQELSDGYATVVGERGFTLSGGQRQRIAHCPGSAP